MSPSNLRLATNRVDFDKNLVFEFFIMFSLFENALKETRFKTADRFYNAMPDWDEFACSIENLYFDLINNGVDENLVEAHRYLLNHPPGKQIYRDEILRFETPSKPADMKITVWISRLIRYVRNNLFHGGKFEYRRPRDTLLIQYSILILETWSELDPK